MTASKLWRFHAKSTCQVVSTLIELLSPQSFSIDDLREEIVFILGCLGSVDFHSLQHGDLPYRHRDPYRVNLVTIGDIKSQLLMQTYNLLWDFSATTISSAKSVLQSLRVKQALPTWEPSVKLLMLHICNFHVLSYLLLNYICKLHWNLNVRRSY